MHFPKFWKKATAGKLVVWGWSDAGSTEASNHAEQRVKRMLKWARGEDENSGPEGRTEYDYPNRPLREEVVREFRDKSNQTTAAVSRNRMGCLVLNTINLLFIDIDEPREKTGFFTRLFGRKKDKLPPVSIEEKSERLVKQWLESHQDWALRVYRTKAGARIVATHAPVPQTDPIVTEVFFAFGADPLYRDLCGRQHSFRARLTPKSWRCKAPYLDVLWPWEDEKSESEFRNWEKRYLDAAKDYATCKFLGQFGAEGIHPDLRELVEYHDSATRVDTDLPLS